MEELQRRLREFRDARDWAQFHTPKNLAISISIEAAELLELYQWSAESELSDEETTQRARGEIADILIYLALMADRLGIDALAAAHAKIRENEKRFPVATSRGMAKPT